jgi:hypothetical protein
MTFAGFVVVRRPEFNYLVPGREVVPRIGDVYYRGVDRQRWIDVFDEDFYSNRTPEDVRMLGTTLRNSNRDFTGIDLCRDEEAASKLLAYSNRSAPSNELIVVRCPELENVNGASKINCTVDWMGYDVVAIGEWSLIAEGVFRNPEYFSKWLPRINPFGLLTDPAAIAEYISTYESAIATGQAEPVAPKSAGLGISPIEIGTIA